ncbi:autotransporter outer membrane beta-barrel domain-containing protein [Bradyrhizobium tunisiense]|uniref:autotransporter family protein n=1 Tax=Bradyrhizobium tunisiense TaxID=3278709 RepID=UPI0035DFF1CD
MKSFVTRKALWLGSAALLALGTSAQAQNIDTMSQWDGTQFISSWGVPNTATYGQTFTPTGAQSRLSGFTFQLYQTSGTAPQYQAFVYAFDPGTQRITGSALFSSGIFTAPSGASFQTVSINTGSVVLSPGQQYVLFLTTSTVTGQANGSYRWGSVANTAIPNGQFVFQNNGTNFAQLSSAGWSNIGQDLAMQAFLSAGNTGENILQAQTGAFQLGNSYLSLLTDPFATNKVTATGAMNYAGEKPVPPAVRSAFGAYMKAPPPQVAYVPRWDVWGAAFGGANTTGGIAAAGTSDIYTRVGGVAAGADYRFTADSLIGFSLAGGNINWSVSPAVGGAGGAGGGTSDTFMAGVYGKYGTGPGYISAAATYTNYWVGTTRSTFVGVDQFKADYNAQGWGGRIEGGYRVGQYWNVNWTPYGAIQGQAYRTGDIAETQTLGAGAGALALAVAGRTATAYRGEVGLRTDRILPIDNGGQLNLFGKIAYAHDEISNPAGTLGFVGLGGLGGAPFTVFGTAPARDLALTTGGAEWRTSNGISFLMKFDGEFGDRSQTYSGTGRIRYTW